MGKRLPMPVDWGFQVEKDGFLFSPRYGGDPNDPMSLVPGSLTLPIGDQMGLDKEAYMVMFLLICKALCPLAMVASSAPESVGPA